MFEDKYSKGKVGSHRRLTRSFARGGPVDAEERFDPEGTGYDYESANAVGMQRDSTGHLGSVAPASEAEKVVHQLGDNAYRVLKGRRHSTYDLAEEGERQRGASIVKRGSRYYSVGGKD